MDVIFDAGAYSSSPAGGVYNYLNEIIPRLSRAPGIHVELLLPKNTSHPFAESPGISVHADRLPGGSWFPDGKVKKLLSRAKRGLSGVVHDLQRPKSARRVFHSPYYTLPPWADIPVVADAHDAISEILPEFANLPHHLELRRKKTECFKRATRLIAVSKLTRDDICREFDFPRERVDVIYRGIDLEKYGVTPSEETLTRLKAKFNLHRPFVLFVGGRRHHKNFGRLVEALVESQWKSDYVLAVVGSAWSDEEETLLKRYGAAPFLQLMTGVSDAELRVLYAAAAAFIFPSLYEGFGLPMLEACAAGTPIAASRTGPLSEVGGDAALYFDPLNPKEMADTVAHLLDPAVAKALGEKGKRRARQFTWEEAVRRTLETYQKVFS